jgi:Polyketide cyclase / dehydrase and lipid transport
MLWLWIVLGALGFFLAAAALCFVNGLRYPRGHEETRSRDVTLSPEEVWAKVTDFTHLPAWQPWYTKVELLRGDGGLGAVWRHVEKGGQSLDLEVTTWEPPRRLVTTIANPNLPFRGSWTFEIEPTAVGSRVTITEKGEIPNPILRTLWHLFKPVKSSAERYLDALV